MIAPTASQDWQARFKLEEMSAQQVFVDADEENYMTGEFLCFTN